MTTNQQVNQMITTHQHELITNTEPLLPKGLFRLYGCTACEFRHTKDCPYCVDGLTHAPDERICDHRKLWLVMITPEYDKPVTLARWQRDVNLNMGHSRQLSEERRVGLMEQQLKLLKKQCIDKEEIRNYEKRLDRAKDRLNMVWRNVTEYADKQVGRETPSKQEITHTMKVTPFDVAQMIRDTKQDDIQDVEYKKVENDDE